MSWISISAQNCSSTKMLFSGDHGHFWHQAGISKVTSSFWTFTISMGLVFRFSRVGASIIIIRKQWGKFHLPIRKEESRLPCTLYQTKCCSNSDAKNGIIFSWKNSHVFMIFYGRPYVVVLFCSVLQHILSTFLNTEGVTQERSMENCRWII